MHGFARNGHAFHFEKWYTFASLMLPARKDPPAQFVSGCGKFFLPGASLEPLSSSSLCRCRSLYFFWCSPEHIYLLWDIITAKILDCWVKIHSVTSKMLTWNTSHVIAIWQADMYTNICWVVHHLNSPLCAQAEVQQADLLQYLCFQGSVSFLAQQAQLVLIIDDTLSFIRTCLTIQLAQVTGGLQLA